MADGVDAAVHRVQPAALQPMTDGPAAEAEGGELSTAHDAVLAPGKRRDGGVGVPRRYFGPHIVLKCRRVWHGRMIAAIP